jgi:phosphoesterase RecJ-like protein
VHVIVDTSSWGQLSDVGVAMRNSTAKRVVIDHHVSAEDLGALEFKDPTREATGALIVDLAESLGWPIPAEAATALFAAIATDTGWFRFAATTGETLRIAGRLIELGASPHTIFRELYERATLARLHLVAALQRIVLTVTVNRLYADSWSDFGIGRSAVGYG